MGEDKGIDYMCNREFETFGCKLVETDMSYFAETIEQAVADAQKYMEDNPPVFVFGAWRKQPRDVGFYSNTVNGYKYSRRIMKAHPLTDAMNKVIAEVNNALGAKFN